MPMYSDAATGISLSLAQSVATLAPSAAYSQWASAIGVSDTTSLAAVGLGTVPALSFDADDLAFRFALAQPVAGPIGFAALSSEGGLGLYTVSSPNGASSTVTLAGVSRMYADPVAAQMFFTFHPQFDCKLETVKLQRAAGITILYGTLKDRINQAVLLNFAIRLSDVGELTFVLNAVTQPTPFKIFWETARDSGVAHSVPAGATWQFDVTGLTPVSQPLPPFVVIPLMSPVSITNGAVLVYGPTIPLREPAHLTVPSGSVKDYITGMLGTGRGRVAGTVKEKGTPNAPVYRKVRLIRERDNMLIRELWSHPITGAYSFDYVDELQLFTVLSYDYTGAYRAVVADRIVPELIP